MSAPTSGGGSADRCNKGEQPGKIADPDTVLTHLRVTDIMATLESIVTRLDGMDARISSIEKIIGKSPNMRSTDISSNTATKGLPTHMLPKFTERVLDYLSEKVTDSTRPVLNSFPLTDYASSRRSMSSSAGRADPVQNNITLDTAHRLTPFLNLTDARRRDTLVSSSVDIPSELIRIDNCGDIDKSITSASGEVAVSSAQCSLSTTAMGGQPNVYITDVAKQDFNVLMGCACLPCKAIRRCDIRPDAPSMVLTKRSCTTGASEIVSSLDKNESSVSNEHSNQSAAEVLTTSTPPSQEDMDSKQVLHKLLFHDHHHTAKTSRKKAADVESNQILTRKRASVRKRRFSMSSDTSHGQMESDTANGSYSNLRSKTGTGPVTRSCNVNDVIIDKNKERSRGRPRSVVNMTRASVFDGVIIDNNKERSRGRPRSVVNFTRASVFDDVIIDNNKERIRGTPRGSVNKTRTSVTPRRSTVLRSSYSVRGQPARPTGFYGLTDEELDSMVGKFTLTVPCVPTDLDLHNIDIDEFDKNTGSLPIGIVTHRSTAAPDFNFNSRSKTFNVQFTALIRYALVHPAYHIISPLFVSSCEDNGVFYNEGEKWIRNGNFLVICKSDAIKVLQCTTDAGTMLDVGTKSHIENGIEYSCLDEQEDVEGSGQQVNVGVCGDFADFSDDIYVGNLVICCISRRFKGCRDDEGRNLKTGYFVVKNNLLKYCNIMQQGWKARVEPKGCFNGTKEDSPDDTRFHVKKFAVWRSGDVDLRCGDEGIAVYRCYVDGKPVYTGSAWIGQDGLVNECK